MKQHLKFLPAFILLCSIFLLPSASCVYKFNEASIAPEYRTVRVNFIENRAPYKNPQLSPNLTDRIRQKIINQTRLIQTNNQENAHYDITGTITDYSVSTTGITSANGQSQTSINRLTVTVKITKTDLLKNTDNQDFTVTRQFDFGATQSLQQAESTLLDEMVRNLTDEIFNRLFSNW